MEIIKIKTFPFQRADDLIYRRNVETKICTELTALTVVLIIVNINPENLFDPKSDFSVFSVGSQKVL